MATALHMPNTALHRPSMDRTPSYDSQTRARSTPPFSSPYDPPSQAQARFSGSGSASNSPHGQPFAGQNYFPPQQGQFYAQPTLGAWSTPLPVSAFQPSQFQFHGYPAGAQGFQGQQQQQQGLAQSQAEFAAWANAYQHMMMAAEQRVPTPSASSTEYVAGEGRHPEYFEGYQGSGKSQDPSPGQGEKGQQQSQPPQQQQQGGFHPYKRGPSRVASRDNMPRSASMPTSFSTTSVSSSSSSRKTPPSFGPNDNPRASSFPVATPTTLNPPTVPNAELPIGKSDLDPEAQVWVPPPRLGEGMRRNSGTSDRSQREDRENVQAGSRSSSPAASSRGTNGRAPTPLYPGPISAAANNTPSNTSPGAGAGAGTRLSPLHNSTVPAAEDKKGGLKGKMFRSKEEKNKATPAGKRSLPPNAFSSISPPDSSSSRASTPLNTPLVTPQAELVAPNAPFSNPLAAGSEVSLAETYRTDITATPSTLAMGDEAEGGKKGKRSLFRMKNMSTDNISLSSTVSSASMMIRKMGSIGKLARRNSLMGISRIFKDKPKDEDAPIPEKDAKKMKKKEAKEAKEAKKKLKNGKGSAAPAELSRTTAEQQRSTLEIEEEDRMLAGLSPAAKLARQHTLRSRAEAGPSSSAAGTAGAPATQGQMPSIETVTSGFQHGSMPPSPGGNTSGAPSVVHVQPRNRTPTIHHAHAIALGADHEYDSDDDNTSEGDTVEDLTMNMGKTSLGSDGYASSARIGSGYGEGDEEFRTQWGRADIDRGAVPKKGILKSISSYSLTNQADSNGRPRSNSAQQSAQPGPGPMAHLPPSDPAILDGLETIVHDSPKVDGAYDPFSPSFSPFDTQSAGINSSASLGKGMYTLPAQNSSLPALSLPHIPQQHRAMTVPTKKKGILWAPECAVYTTYDCGTYDRRSEPATCNRLTPELAMAIKQELNAFKLEMPIHPESRVYTHYFAWCGHLFSGWFARS